MDLSNLFSRLIVLFIYILVGFIAAKVRKIESDTVKKVNTVLLYIGQPAMIISSVLDTRLTMSVGDIGELFLLAVIMQLLLLLFAYIFIPIFVRKKADRGLFKFMAAFGNVGFMGFPIVSALYGPDAVFLAAICIIPFFLSTYSIGIVMVKGGTKGEKLGWKFLLNPALISTFAAVALFFLKLPLPTEVLEAASGLAGILIPLSMVCIGANLGMNRPSELIADWRMFALSFLKLIICPILIFIICRIFVSNEVYLGILVVSAAMPSAVLASMFSTEYGADVNVASRGVFITTLLSLVTIPAVLHILFG
ncbi:MAG: AEC family transporter [Ruminococcaceae bacterium]|nr:AEC family transporter [Oscillospiraceae bacterium]